MTIRLYFSRILSTTIIFLTVGLNNFQNKIPCLLHCLFSEDTNSKISYTINFIRHSKLRLSTHCHYFFPLIILTLFLLFRNSLHEFTTKRENHKIPTSTISLFWNWHFILYFFLFLGLDNLLKPVNSQMLFFIFS